MMDNTLFWELYRSGSIQCKVYADGSADDSDKMIEAFEYDGRFYLRIIYQNKWITGVRSNGKKYRMSRVHCVFKEFDNKNSANSYFKKASDGLKRIS